MHKRIFIAVVTYVTHSCGSLLLQRLCTMMKFSLWFIGDGHLRIISVKLKLFFKTKLNLFFKADLNCNGYRHFPPQLTCTLGRYPGKIVIRIAIYTRTQRIVSTSDSDNELIARAMEFVHCVEILRVIAGDIALMEKSVYNQSYLKPN